MIDKVNQFFKVERFVDKESSQAIWAVSTKSGVNILVSAGPEENVDKELVDELMFLKGVYVNSPNSELCGDALVFKQELEEFFSFCAS